MSKKASAYIKRFRRRLYELNPFCIDCGVKMILPEDVPKDAKKRNPGNMCTVEHTRSRWNPERGKPTNGERVNMILCRNCNGKQNKKEEKAIPLEIKHIKSKNHKNGKTKESLISYRYDG